jgi:GLPGLI family protein
MEYPLEEIKWKIDRTTKVVAGYKCQLATGTWKGRQYKVWFTTDLPLPAGPWKLHGLPGVILEAADTKKEVSFTATAVQKKSQLVPLISLPGKAVAVTESQLKKLMEAPLTASGNDDIKVTASISGQKTGSVKAKGINNPLEKEK